jgi:hypothetical protein
MSYYGRLFDGTEHAEIQLHRLIFPAVFSPNNSLTEIPEYLAIQRDIVTHCIASLFIHDNWLVFYILRRGLRVLFNKTCVEPWSSPGYCSAVFFLLYGICSSFSFKGRITENIDKPVPADTILGLSLRIGWVYGLVLVALLIVWMLSIVPGKIPALMPIFGADKKLSEHLDQLFTQWQVWDDIEKVAAFYATLWPLTIFGGFMGTRGHSYGQGNVFSVVIESVSEMFVLAFIRGMYRVNDHATVMSMDPQLITYNATSDTPSEYTSEIVYNVEYSDSQHSHEDAMLSRWKRGSKNETGPHHEYEAEFAQAIFNHSAYGPDYVIFWSIRSVMARFAPVASLFSSRMFLPVLILLLVLTQELHSFYYASLPDDKISLDNLFKRMDSVPGGDLSRYVCTTPGLALEKTWRIFRLQNDIYASRTEAGFPPRSLPKSFLEILYDTFVPWIILLALMPMLYISGMSLYSHLYEKKDGAALRWILDQICSFPSLII